MSQDFIINVGSNYLHLQVLIKGGLGLWLRHYAQSPQSFIQISLLHDVQAQHAAK